MKWLKTQHHDHREEEDSFPRLSSFVCDSEEDEPFSEHDLRAIEAIESHFHSDSSNNKRPRHSPSDHSPRRNNHHRRQLPKSLIALQHPNSSSLSPCQDWQLRRSNLLDPNLEQGYSRRTLPIMKFGGKIMYSRTFHDVEKTATKLLKILEEKKRETVEIALGFDIEWRPTFKRGVPPGKVAVMQICDGTDHCYVLHLIHSGVPPNLQHLLEDPSILKVGAGIGSDAVKVFRDYNISIKGVEDLSFHANKRLGGRPQHWGLASLAEKLLSKQLKKPNKIRLGNWESPVLSEMQLEYAATDAFASWYLYQVIKNLPEPQESADKLGEVQNVMSQ